MSTHDTTLSLQAGARTSLSPRHLGKGLLSVITQYSRKWPGESGQDRPLSKQAHLYSIQAIGEDVSLEAIADVLEKYRIKRVPIVWDDKLVGIISRADLFHGLVARQVDMPPSIDDREIKKTIESWQTPA